MGTRVNDFFPKFFVFDLTHEFLRNVFDTV